MQRKRSSWIIPAVFIIALAAVGFLGMRRIGITSDQMGAVAAAVITKLNYMFTGKGTLYEAGAMSESANPYFWLNSGAKLLEKDGTGSTVMGDLPARDKWRALYARSNPVDTDNGLHPQNVFRLITRSRWDNAVSGADFFIAADRFSASPNRNASNGLLLMSRYRDNGQTLYYAGIRVDGTAVIKKKYGGTYYTMAEKRLFSGTYSIAGNVNLLPHNEWLSLRQTTVTDKSGAVAVELALKRAGEQDWTTILAATDSGQYGGTPPITGAGFSGIRTDFMDVKFDNYAIEPV